MTTDIFQGCYCEGQGDTEYLQLLEKQFAFFHPNPETQNISMLYEPCGNALTEGTAWGTFWWIQNSYGPTYGALPFLREPWMTCLQHSQDYWFKWQGDGITEDNLEPYSHDGDKSLIPPAGCLVDTASATGAVHRQGDGNWRIHDWFTEATAAGIILQAEVLLISRDKERIGVYLPKLELAADFLESRRDPQTNLLLTGPASNLLAPSYGGVKMPDGTFGKGYLTGLAITYLEPVRLS